MAKRGSYNPGPVTPAGKETASKNATVHGGRSERHTILPDERPEDFLDIVNKWTVEFEPQGDLEIGYVATIAEREWMVLRCERNQERVLSELMLAHANPLDWSKDQHRVLGLMQRYLTAAQRQMNMAVKALQDLRRARIAQIRLEHITQLKVAEVLRKVELGRKMRQIDHDRLDAERIQMLKEKNVEEWELLVLRAEAKKQEEERDTKDSDDPVMPA